jgi:hypothetical protein
VYLHWDYQLSVSREDLLHYARIGWVRVEVDEVNGEDVVFGVGTVLFRYQTLVMQKTAAVEYI